MEGKEEEEKRNIQGKLQNSDERNQSTKTVEKRPMSMVRKAQYWQGVILFNLMYRLNAIKKIKIRANSFVDVNKLRGRRLKLRGRRESDPVLKEKN